MISFTEIFKQAYALLRAHKFLWALGLFLFWDMAANAVSYAVNQNRGMPLRLAPTAAIVLTLAGLAFLALSFRARAAIIWSTKSLTEKKPANFSRSFFEARKYYKRVFGVWFVSTLFMVVAAGILVAPVAYLISIGYSERAAVLGFLALLIFVPLAAIANFINNLAPMFVVFYNMNFQNALNVSLDLIRKFWFVFLWFSVSLGLLMFLAGYLIVAVGGSGVVFLVKIFYNTPGIHITTSSVLLGLCAFAAFLIFSGYLAAYQQIAWVLLFRKFIRPVKDEEEEIVPVPEPIN